MSDPLYKKELLRLAADAHSAGRLANPSASGEAFNSACGDKVTVDVALDGDRVAGFAHDTKACVLTQASASILGQTLKGKSRGDIEALANDLAAMLVTKAAPPASPFDVYSVFEGATEHRNRHRCVLLPIEAVLSAFDNSDAS
ncbi:MAG: iron-sulfur cluster assembly scaffold protein [Rhizomicrobium sp.]